jgi:hydroxymethylpyrimidine pyrophosphatase-like HAD family hydrolase
VYVCPSLFFLEVAQNGIDKGASVKFLADKLNILQSEVIAVGNAGNDLSMIEYAGLVWLTMLMPICETKPTL